MHKKIEEEILHVIKWLTREHGLKEQDINRLKKILIDIAHNYFGDRFYSGKNIVDELDWGAWFQPNIHSYLSNLPHHKVFELFKDNDINDLYNLDYIFDQIDFKLFYTYEELSNIIKSFITYLLNNRNEIISTGFPLKSFESSLWFYTNLSKLYPVKIPYLILRKGKDTDGNFLLEYHWRETPRNSIHLSNLENQDFFNASYNKDYSFSNADLIVRTRSILFDLKIEILNILLNSLLNKNYLRLWDQCFKCISDKISIEDFKSFNKIDEIKDTIPPGISTDENQKNLSNNMLHSDYFFEKGGLAQIIELIFHIEKELRLSPINEIKTKLLDLGKNKKISTYYDLLLNINISDLFTIGKEYFKKYKEENRYKVFFKDRLSNDLKKSFKTSLSDKSDRSDSNELIIKSFINKINLKTDLTESKDASKANKNNIIPNKLPPNTKWENIVIQFIDNENIKITAPYYFKHISDYIQMGFKDNKKLCPNSQWRFLQLLSLRKGRLSLKDLTEKPVAMKQKDIEKLINQAKKRKQFLSKRLKDYFQINEDPFYDYRKKHAYEIKFHLFPQKHIQDILQ
jgi:hypothetical protein